MKNYTFLFVLSFGWIATTQGMESSVFESDAKTTIFEINKSNKIMGTEYKKIWRQIVKKYALPTSPEINVIPIETWITDPTGKRIKAAVKMPYVDIDGDRWKLYKDSNDTDFDRGARKYSLLTFLPGLILGSLYGWSSHPTWQQKTYPIETRLFSGFIGCVIGLGTSLIGLIYARHHYYKNYKNECYPQKKSGKEDLKLYETLPKNKVRIIIPGFIKKVVLYNRKESGSPYCTQFWDANS